MSRECMDCGESMQLRKNKDGDKFWGCTAFPDCRYTENVEDEIEEGFDENNIKYND